MSIFLHLCETHNAFSAARVIAAVLLLVFCKLCLESFEIVNRYSWFWMSLTMVDRGSEFSFFRCIHVKIDIRIDIFISIKPTASKFGKQVYLEELTQMNLFLQILVTSSNQDHLTNWKHYIPTINVTMATKLGRMYRDGLLPIKPHDALITWSCEIKWQNKTIIFLLPRFQ